MASRRAGAPAGRGLMVAVVLLVLAASSCVAYVIGRHSRTPAEIAARARPPKPSLVTAPVRLAHPHALFAFRATMVDVRPENVAFPASGGPSVVTKVAVVRGMTVGDGGLLGAVSGRPVIVFRGVVPAYQSMSLGTRGVDVAELQAGLEAFGISIGEDTSGVYGQGTAAAVARLTWHYGFQPTTQEVSVGHGRERKVESYATVPLGQMDLVPSLPATVASVAQLGQVLGSGKPFAQLSSGRLSLTAKTDPNTASLLRVGMVGEAVSDVSGKSVAVRVKSVGRPQPSPSPGAGPQAAVVFTPVVPARAESLVGQNLAVHVRTGSGTPKWVVPAAALVTDAAGRSSLTVLVDGRQRRVPVRAGALLQGAQVVYPYPGRGRLHRNEPVVIGVASK